MDSSLEITILLSLYLFFMFRHFKTHYCIHHPLEYYFQDRLGDFFKHPFHDTGYNNKICPFGHQAILVLIGFLWLRWYLEKKQVMGVSTIKTLSRVFMVIVLITSLLNLNATLYLIPYFVLELYKFR